MSLADGLAVASNSPSEDAPPPVQPYSPGYAQAAERILDYITRNNLGPGDRLPTEADLGRQIGFSRAVTREAIKVLSALGRVSAHRGRGLFVAAGGGLLGSELVQQFRPTNLDDVSMLFEFRRTQEAELARLAALRATPADVRAVEDAAAKSRAAIPTGTLDEITELDHAFHRAVAAAARNDLLGAAREVASRLQHQSAVIGLASEKGDVDAAAAEHDAIAEAIRNGAPERAEAAAKEHMDRTYRDYHAAIEHGLFASRVAAMSRDGSD